MNNEIIDIYYDLVYKKRCEELKAVGLSNEELNNYENFKDLYTEEEFKKTMNIKQNRKNKRYRTKNKFKELFKLKEKVKNGKVVFISIQPNDTLLNQEERTYTKKINEWLKEHFLYSILNKDYGDLTGREHYHALAITTEEIEQLFHEDGTPKRSNSGYLMYELIRKDFSKISKSKELQFEPTLNLVDLEKDSLGKTVNYLLKLNNHSNKSTTKSRVRIIKSPLMKTMFELRKEK